MDHPQFHVRREAEERTAWLAAYRNARRLGSKGAPAPDDARAALAAACLAARSVATRDGSTDYDWRTLAGTRHHRAALAEARA